MSQLEGTLELFTFEKKLLTFFFFGMETEIPEKGNAVASSIRYGELSLNLISLSQVMFWGLERGIMCRGSRSQGANSWPTLAKFRVGLCLCNFPCVLNYLQEYIIYICLEPVLLAFKKQE